MTRPDPPPSERRPNSEEVAPVTAPSVPGRSALGVFLIIFGLAVTAAALGVILAQWLWGRAADVDPAGLWLAALAGLIWAGAGLALWRRMWLMSGLGIAVALVLGAIATWTIRG